MKKEEYADFYVSPDIRIDNVKTEHGFAFSTQDLDEDSDEIRW